MGLNGKKKAFKIASTPDPSSNASSPRHGEQQADMKVAPEAALLGIGGGEKHTQKSAVSKHSTCTFFMLSADFVRKFPGKSLPFFQDIRDKFTTDEPLVEVVLDYADVVKGTHIKTTLAVSHRWMQPDHPDPDGEQLKALKDFLNSTAGKKIERVWIDSACMPQDLPKSSRSAEDAAAFKRMLKKVNRLYLGTTVLILLDMSYVSRFWTQFESWMSMQYTTPSGLKSAVGTRNERHHIVCIQNAAAQAESFAKLLVDQWAKKTPQQAHSFLSKPDVTVTNQSDKEAQLPKIKALDTTVQGAFSEVAREIEEELAASEAVAARAEAELAVWEAENHAKASEKHRLKVAALQAASVAAAAREAKTKHEQAIARGLIPAIMEQKGAAAEVYEPRRPPCLCAAPLRLAGRCAPAYLDLSGMCLGPASASLIALLIAGSEVLAKLNLDGCELDLPKLRGTDPVTSLDLSGKRLGPASAIVIASLIAGNGVLKTLDLRSNEIGDEGTTAIADALKGNAVLTSLDLRSNGICGLDDRGRGTYSAAGIIALAEALKVNAVLTNLDLSANGISDEGAAAIAEALRGNGVLTTLNLQANNIGDEGAAAFGEALAVNGVLTNLNLFYNSIGDEGAMAVASALRVNGVLTTLKLDDNNVGDEGATALASALRVNRVLTDLNLAHNSIDDTGAEALASALRVNGVLKSIDLEYNNLGDKGKGAIRDAVSGRVGLKREM